MGKKITFYKRLPYECLEAFSQAQVSPGHPQASDEDFLTYWPHTGWNFHP
jgi:hypothetical protein